MITPQPGLLYMTNCLVLHLAYCMPSKHIGGQGMVSHVKIWCKKVLLTLMKEARVFLYNPKKPFLICTMSTSQRVTTTRTRVVSSVPRPCACLVCVWLHWHMFVHVFPCVCQCVCGMYVGMCGWVFEILKNEVKVSSRSHIYTFMDLYSRWAK